MVVCHLTKEEVSDCTCGPHQECPEHLLNCLLSFDWKDENLSERDQEILDDLFPFTRRERLWFWIQDNILDRFRG